MTAFKVSNMNGFSLFLAMTFWVYHSGKGTPFKEKDSIKEKTLWIGSARHILVRNESGSCTDTSGQNYCLEKHMGFLSHINNTIQLKLIRMFTTKIRTLWNLNNNDTSIFIRTGGNKCVRINTDESITDIILDEDTHNLSRLSDCQSDTSLILCQTVSVSTQRYYVAAGRKKCPRGTEQLATGSVFMGAKQCALIDGLYLGSPSENQLVQCSLDWCGTDSPTSDGLVMAAKNRCSTSPVYSIAVRMYKQYCDVMKGTAERNAKGQWQWTNCFFDWCAGSELNRDTYTSAAVGQCPPGTWVAQGLIYTTAAECRVIRGNMFGTYKDWERIGCILDWCRIGKDCKKTQLGTKYNGTVSTTISGRTCQRWDTQTPHPHTNTNPEYFPETDVTDAKNYCRNPAGWTEGPFCFTTDPSTQWEVCDVPLCNGIDVSPASFTVGYSKYIFEPGLHRDIYSWCQSQYGADLVFIDTEEKLELVNGGLKSLEEIRQLIKQEIWVAGSTNLEHNFKITNMSQVKSDGVGDRCLYLSNWNSTAEQYGGDKFELYSTTCQTYRRRFLCENVEVKYPGFKLDGGVEQKDITEENACKISCVKSCMAVEYNSFTKQCIHHYKQTACRPGKATPPFKQWVHIRKHHCDCNTLLVSGPDGVLNQQITSSSQTEKDQSDLTSLIRLDTQEKMGGVQSAGWIAKGSKSVKPFWIQVDFGQVRYVYAVVTQGVAGSNPCWTTAYKIQYFRHQWITYKEKNSVKVFVGNKDQDTWVVNGFNAPIVTTSIRLMVVRWYRLPGLRLDFIGCLAKQENLALKKPTFQSSVGNRGYPPRAVDGFLFTNYKSGSCIQTKKEQFPWFAVDLEDMYHISEVRITSRRDCCNKWLSDFTVYVSYDFAAARHIKTNDLSACGHLSGYVSGGATAKVHCKQNTIGRFVIVHMNRAKNPLTLCEVEIFGRKENSKNLALRRPTYQSGATASSAARAADGRTHSAFSQGSCSRTSRQKDPWWIVQLDDDYTISHVTVTNRGDCCGELLHDFRILAGYAFDTKSRMAALDEFALCKELKGPRKNGETIRVTCDEEVMGRFVAITIPGNGQILSLCEVQIYGEKVPITTFGGTDGQSKCSIPFYYNETYHTSCITQDKDRPWCATTGNFSADQQWGYCQDVRLYHGRHEAEGVVRVKVGDRWYGICDDMWDDADAKIVCRQLGYSDGIAVYPPTFPSGSGSYGLSEVQCHGNETGLAWCPHIVTTQGTICRKGEEAGVSCKHNLPDNSMFVGFPAFARQHTNKWKAGIFLLNEVIIKHHCNITAFSYYAQQTALLFTIQIWRPTIEPDAFVLIDQWLVIPYTIGFQEIELSDIQTKSLFPGDKVGICFVDSNPVPFDYSSTCEQPGLHYYKTIEPYGTMSGRPNRFLKKIERNNICRYYSLSLKVKVTDKPKLHDFEFGNKLYSVQTLISTKEQSKVACHRKMGQNGTLLRVDNLREQQELCSWLSDIGANGSFWLAPRLHELTNGKSFTQWKRCEPDQVKDCVVMSIMSDEWCIWHTQACHMKAQTICQFQEPKQAPVADIQHSAITARTESHSKLHYYVLIMCFVVIGVAIAATTIYFLRQKHKNISHEAEPIVRYSYDNNEHDNDHDNEQYKGLDNPSFSFARPYNEYQELMVKHVKEDEEQVEDIDDVCDANADCNVVEPKLVEASASTVALNSATEPIEY